MPIAVKSICSASTTASASFLAAYKARFAALASSEIGASSFFDLSPYVATLDVNFAVF